MSQPRRIVYRGPVSCRGLIPFFLAALLGFPMAGRVGSAAVTAVNETDGKPEYEARATFLILLSKYTQWPEHTFGDGEFVMGVLGEDPFGSALDVHEGSFVQGRRLVIKRFRSAAKVGPCQLLYIPASEEWQLNILREKIAAGNVLTVGESRRFTEAGGAICLFTESGSLRFEVNLAALEHSHVRVESKVLRLAKQVH